MASYAQEEQMEARGEMAKEDRLARRYPHNASNTIEKDAPLKRALKNQEQLLIDLGAELDTLQQRLLPITVDVPEADMKDTIDPTPHIGDSQIVRGVVDLNRTIEEYIKKVIKLRGRLEI
jgi:hypothetical protein